MRRMIRPFTLVVALAVTIGLVGCGSSEMTMDETAAADGDKTIIWLNEQLTAEGVYIQARGSAGFELQAEETSRMILNSQDLIDAYYYGDTQTAQEQAADFANVNPDLDVYQNDGLVVVRYTNRGEGVTSTLRNIMGPTV